MHTSPWKGWLAISALGLILLTGGFALQFQSYTASVALVHLCTIACLLIPFGLPVIDAKKPALIILALCGCAWWFAGLDTPPNWDGVQTSIRAEVFWNSGEFERFSLYYPILGVFTGPFVSTVPARLFNLICGAIAAAAIAWGSMALAGRRNGIRAGILFFFLPPFFILYRFIMLDTWLVMLWSLALACTLQWSRRLTWLRLSTIVLLTALSAASKEIGALIAVPVIIGLLALAPAKERKRRLIIVGILTALVIITGGTVLYRYAQVKGIDSFFGGGVIESGQGLTFLPFNENLEGSWTKFLKIIHRQHWFFWAQTGLIVPMVFAFFRPRVTWAGCTSLALGSAAQLYWMLECRPHRWKDVYTYPLFDGNLPGKAVYPFFLFILVTVILCAFGKFRFELRRKHLIPLAMILVPTVALHLFVKVHHGEGDYLHVWQAWHYLPGIALGGLMLAAAGLRQLTRLSMPLWLQIPFLMVLVVTVLNGMLHSVGMSLHFRNHAMARLDAYEILKTRENRIVYTHWPFSYIGTEYSGTDVGPLAWETDGWNVQPIWDLANPSYRPQPGALVIWDDFHTYGFAIDKVEEQSRLRDAVTINNWRLALFHPGIERKDPRSVYIREIE